MLEFMKAGVVKMDSLTTVSIARAGEDGQGQAPGEGHLPLPDEAVAVSLVATRRLVVFGSKAAFARAMCDHVVGELILLFITMRGASLLQRHGGDAGVYKFRDLRGVDVVLPVVVTPPAQANGRGVSTDTALERFPELCERAATEGKAVTCVRVQSIFGGVVWTKWWWAGEVLCEVDRGTLAMRLDALKDLGAPACTPGQLFLLPGSREGLQAYLAQLEPASDPEGAGYVNAVLESGVHVAHFQGGAGPGGGRPAERRAVLGDRCRAHAG